MAVTALLVKRSLYIFQAVYSKIKALPALDQIVTHKRPFSLTVSRKSRVAYLSVDSLATMEI